MWCVYTYIKHVKYTYIYIIYLIEKLSEKKRINMKILGRIPSSSDWVMQDACWSRNTGMGPDRGHVRQPWSCRWGIKSITEDQRFLISSWSSSPDVLDWPRAVCLLFSPSKRAKNLSGPHYILHKSREVDQTKNTGAEQLPAVRAFLIVSGFSLPSSGSTQFRMFQNL